MGQRESISLLGYMAKRVALIYTLVANAELQGIEPIAYMRDVIARIADSPYKTLDDLLAANWKKPIN